MERVERLASVSVVIGAATVGGLWLLFAVFGDVDVVGGLRRLDPVTIAAAMGLHALFWLFWAGRIWTLTRELGIPISFARSQAIVLSSLFAASVTPSYAGGEPVRFYLIGKEGGHGKAGAIVFTERFLDTAFFGIVAIVSLFYLYGLIESPVLKSVFFAAGVLLVLAMVVFVVSLRSIEVLERVLKTVLRPVALVKPDLAEGLEERLEGWVEDFHDALVTIVREKKTAVLAAAVLTVGQWTAELLIPYVIFLGLGSPITPLEAAAGNAMLTVLLMVPLTPGGSGLAEVGAVAIYRLFDDSAAVALFPLPWRIVTYYANLVVGLFVSAVLLKDMDLLNRKVAELTE